MDRLQEMQVFVAVAQEQGFSAAARRLGLSAASVTRAVAALEVRIGTRLLTRTTRSLHLSEAGQRYLEDCRRILADIQEAEASAAGSHAQPRGQLTITAPVLFGELFVTPVLADPSTRIAQRMSSLDDAATAMIRGADTFFVASYVDVDNSRAVDVSHRGGLAGFVQVEGDCLTIPDFAGNLHFNTLGNLLLNPRAGLLFIDFTSGDLLQVSGHTEIILEGPQVEAFQGAERLWKLHVQHVVRRPAALALRWRFDGVSPNSLLTGTWEQAATRLQP